MDKKLIATLEAVLFATGEPTEISKISQALSVDEIILEEALSILMARYNREDSGICLLKLDDKYQLCSKTEFADSIRKIIEAKKNTPLSQAAFEVLAIVAYNQPVTKAFIEQIRGVDCSAVISNLCQKSLIEEKGRLDLPGRPLIYGTTPEFLRCFCISSLDELPPLPKSGEENEETVNNEEKDEQILN
ncbi:MAG: SMC-Scp complex subunit ScpB [Ruminococcaceae bacterium]|nr:SMC-Scp complex subunit ScpB [Oscillospiraceae bacterium]